MIQFLGFIYAFFLIISSFGKTTRQILIMQTISFIFKGIHYYLLGGMSGALTSIISVVRNLTFYQKETSKMLSIIFIILYLVIGIVTYNGAFSIIPVLATIFYTFIINYNNVKYLRISLIFTSILWLIYNVYINSYSGIIIQIFTIFSSILGYIKLDKKS